MVKFYPYSILDRVHLCIIIPTLNISFKDSLHIMKLSIIHTEKLHVQLNEITTYTH